MAFITMLHIAYVAIQCLNSLLSCILSSFFPPTSHFCMTFCDINVHKCHYARSSHFFCSVLLEKKDWRGQSWRFCLMWAQIKCPVKRLPSIFIELARPLDTSALAVDSVILPDQYVCVCAYVCACSEGVTVGLMNWIHLLFLPKRQTSLTWYCESFLAHLFHIEAGLYFRNTRTCVSQWSQMDTV